MVGRWAHCRVRDNRSGPVMRFCSSDGSTGMDACNRACRCIGVSILVQCHEPFRKRLPCGQDAVEYGSSAAGCCTWNPRGGAGETAYYASPNSNAACQSTWVLIDGRQARGGWIST